MRRVSEIRKVQRRKGSLYDRVFTRRVSAYVTALLIRLGVVSPNAITAFNTLMGLLAWAMIGAEWHLYVGVGLIHVYAILDSVDGEVARATGRTSLAGMYLEDHSAYLMIHGYWLAMGAYLANTVGSSWPWLMAVLYVAFGRSAMPAARRALLKAIEGERRLPEDLPEPYSHDSRALTGVVGLVFVDFLHPSTVWAVSTTVLVVERLLLGGGRALLVVVAMYLALSALREVGTVLRLARRPTLEAHLVGVVVNASEMMSLPPRSG